MPSMTSPSAPAIPPPEPGDRPPPEPGDRPPPARLERPPSDRYAPRRAGGPAGRVAPGSAGRSRSEEGDGDGRATLLALVPAVSAALLTAIGLVLVGGVLAERRGLLALAGIGGAAIGLLAATPAASPDGILPALVPRARATRIAIALAVAAIAVGAIGTWVYSLAEGGVLGPFEYVWTVLGPWTPAEAAIAAIAAAWGVGAGPVRWRG